MVIDLSECPTTVGLGGGLRSGRRTRRRAASSHCEATESPIRYPLPDPVTLSSPATSTVPPAARNSPASTGRIRRGHRASRGHSRRVEHITGTADGSTAIAFRP